MSSIISFGRKMMNFDGIAAQKNFLNKNHYLEIRKTKNDNSKIQIFPGFSNLNCGKYLRMKVMKFCRVNFCM